MDWIFEEGRMHCLDENGGLIAEANFTPIKEGLVDIDHTYVAPHLRGQGLAGEMMSVVADHLKEKGLKATASCSYANAWLRRNRGAYPDIISEDIDNQAYSCRMDGNH